jgi:hypothetical protein
MDFKQRPLNQSLISRFLYKGEERETLCPKKIYCIDIAKTHHYRTGSMLNGSYFETLCIGSGAGGRITNDLPRKRLVKARELENIKRKESGLPEVKGDKTMDQIRIEQQAQRFKLLSAKYQITVLSENTQVKVKVPWHKNPEIMLSGEFDIFPTAIITSDGLKLAIIDLKLTADINGNFGEYCWGAPEFMDLIQAYMYHYIARQVIDHVGTNPHITEILTKPAVELIKQNQLEFYYWVFNYKKESLEDKLVKVVWDATKETELHEAIRKTVSLIEYYEQLQWPTKPQYKLCKECTVFSCPDKTSIQNV